VDEYLKCLDECRQGKPWWQQAVCLVECAPSTETPTTQEPATQDPTTQEQTTQNPTTPPRSTLPQTSESVTTPEDETTESASTTQQQTTVKNDYLQCLETCRHGKPLWEQAACLLECADLDLPDVPEVTTESATVSSTTVGTTTTPEPERPVYFPWAKCIRECRRDFGDELKIGDTLYCATHCMDQLHGIDKDNLGIVHKGALDARAFRSCSNTCRADLDKLDDLSFIVDILKELLEIELPELGGKPGGDLQIKLAKRLFCIQSCRDSKFCLAGEVRPVEEDCTSYYKCVDGKETKTRCGFAHLFDKESSTCKPFYGVTC